MAYEKLNLSNGATLDAGHLAHMEQGIADALPATELDAAIETALATAKESGEFDGADGKDGTDGADGVGVASVEQTTTSTADGGTNVVTVTLTNGVKSTFSVKNGTKGSPGEAGSDGADGYTPVKGTDYWTPLDKQEMVNDVLAALPVYAGEVEDA